METLTRAFEDERPGLHIPWRNLAHLLQIPPGILVIVLGAPGALKSMFSLAWCLELDEPTRIISLDTDPRTQASRIIARGTGIPSAKILEDRPRWAPWLREQKLKLKVGIQPTSAIEVGEVIAADTEFWGKAPALVVVDDVSKLKMDRDYSSYDGAFLELHRAAKRHNTVVMAIHHLHRGDSSARTKPIRLTDGKYTGEYEAPIVLGLWRPQHNQLKVGILKNRFGPDDPEGLHPVDLYADPSICDIRDSYTPGIAVGRESDYDPIAEGLIRP